MKAFKMQSAYGWVSICYNTDGTWYGVKEATGEMTKIYNERIELLAALKGGGAEWI